MNQRQNSAAGKSSYLLSQVEEQIKIADRRRRKNRRMALLIRLLANRLRKGFWFLYEALLRIALELEFGETYKDYAEKRDGIVEPGAARNGGPAALLFT